jgi:hypothetical protein
MDEIWPNLVPALAMGHGNPYLKLKPKLSGGGHEMAEENNPGL